MTVREYQEELKRRELERIRKAKEIRERMEAELKHLNEEFDQEVVDFRDETFRSIGITQVSTHICTVKKSQLDLAILFMYQKKKGK